ncbi:MAG: WD40 repeat domain-containing protein [Rhodococcus sp.]|nr:WD40 repeat domain-containing protein [Rhodococcus sp. (in: high G+C Gram-positive bacteria)]
MEDLDSSDHPRAKFAERFSLLYDVAGRPVLKRLADHANAAIVVTDSRRSVFVSAQRLSDWRSGRNVPARFEGLAATVRVLIAAARSRQPQPPVDGLYSVRVWQQWWEQAARSEVGTPRASAAPPPTPAVEVTEPPYRGLAAFTAQDSRFFFGRGRASEALATLVRASIAVRAPSEGDDLDPAVPEPDELDAEPLSLSVLVGASGSGKSSLLYAGLAPLLAPEYELVALTPGSQPITKLTEALAAVPVGTRTVLVIDQCEELFTQTVDDHLRTQFIDQLTTIARTGRYGTVVVDAVVIAVRADFYEQCLRYPQLASSLQDAQMVLGQMTPAEITSAVECPAHLVGVPVEPGLVNLMLRDLGAPPALEGVDTPELSAAQYSAGALPLLSHALLATWQARTGAELSIRAYTSVGGVHGAVARTADQVWEGLSPRQQVAARQLLTELVTVSEDGPDTRRKVHRSDLLAACTDSIDAAGALRQLISSRLVTSDSHGVELTHEALLHAWPRLADWLREDRANAVLRQRIDKDAREWDQHDRDRSLLYRGLRLESALAWTADHSNRILPTTRAFVTAAEKHGRAVRLRGRVLVVALTVLAIVASVAAVTAHFQRAAATDQRNAAQYAELLAQASRAQVSDPSRSAQLALTAHEGRPDDAAAYTMTVATQNAPLASELGAHGGAVYHTAVSSTGIAASASYDRTIRLWDVARGVQVGPALEGHTSWVTSVAFSPDGRILASGSGDRTVRLWDVSDPESPRPIGIPREGHTGAIYMVAFAPDGRTVASASDDSTVRLWSIGDSGNSDAPDPTGDGTVLSGHSAAVRSVAFAPDGQMLVSGSDDHTARLWDLRRPLAPTVIGAPLVGHSDTVHSVAFSPDGTLLATGSDDQSVRLWFTNGHTQPLPAREPLTGHDAAIWSIGFSPDGSALVSASWDGTAKIWSLADPNTPTTLGQPLAGSSGGLTTAVFTPDGHSVLTGGQDGLVRRWTLSDAVLTGHSLRVATPAVSADGRVMVTGSRDTTAVVWDVPPGQVPRKRAQVSSPDGLGIEAVAISDEGTQMATVSLGSGHIQLWNIAGDPVPQGPPLTVAARYTHAVAFSPGGDLLATASDDQSLQLWQLRDGQPPVPAGPPLIGAGGWINGIEFSPDGTLLAAASSDQKIHVWDVSAPSAPTRAMPPLTGHDGAVNSVSFSADGDTLASSSDDQTIRIWTKKDDGWAPGGVLTGHTSTIRSVSFAPQGRILASGSDDQSVRLWNVDDPDNPHAVGDSIVPAGTVRWRVVYGASPDVLLAAGEGGAVRMLDLNIEHARDRVCRATGGELLEPTWAKYLTDEKFQSPCT